MLGEGLGGPGSISGVGEMEIFLDSFLSRLILGSIQPPVKLVLGVKMAKCRARHPTSSWCCDCEYVDIYIHMLHGLSWPVMRITLPFYNSRISWILVKYKVTKEKDSRRYVLQNRNIDY